MAVCGGMGDQNMNDERKDKITVLTVMSRIDGRRKKGIENDGYGQEGGRAKEYGQQGRSGRGAGL